MRTDQTVSQQLANFIRSTEFDDLPPAAVEQAKCRLLDAVSTAISSRGLPVPQIALKFVGASTGEATIFGYGKKATAIDAGFVNATLVNGTTHDDFLHKSHPGAVVIPAACAVGEEEGSTGKEIIAAIVLGYEIVARAYLGGPAMLPYFRATGVAGAIGAAATAGKLQHLSAGELANALGCSAMFASGFGEGFLSGTTEVKLNVGWACRSGISAAALARQGATASPTVFEGQSGFYNALARTAEHASEATRDLGRHFLIEDVHYKERPVCYFVQTPVQLAYQFAQGRKLDSGKIGRVFVAAPESTYTNPGYQNEPPYRTPLHSRVSAKFCVAAALLGKPIHEYGYYGNIGDPDVLALVDRIELASDVSERERVHMEIFYDGASHRLDGTESETLRPTVEKIIEKFRRLTSEFLGDRTESIIDTVLHLEKVQNIREVMKEFSGERN